MTLFFMSLLSGTKFALTL